MHRKTKHKPAQSQRVATARATEFTGEKLVGANDTAVGPAAGPALSCSLGVQLYQLVFFQNVGDIIRPVVCIDF